MDFRVPWSGWLANADVTAVAGADNEEDESGIVIVVVVLYVRRRRSASYS